MSNRRPALDDLATLVLVAERGSIGKAAAELRLAQPTVSRRMDALERALGVPVLHRAKTGTTLTPTGRVVVGWATTLLDAADDFSRAVTALRARRSVAVRVAASMTVAEHYAPDWLARLSARRRDVEVSLEVTNSAEVADLVEAGQVDLGLLETPRIRRGLGRRRITWDHLVVAVHPDHPWAKGAAVPVRELATTPLLLREPGSGTRETLDQALRRLDLEATPGLVMASNTALRAAAAAGMGPVVLSEVALAGDLATGRLVEVPVTDLVLRRPISAVWRVEDGLSPSAAVLLEVAGTRG